MSEESVELTGPDLTQGVELAGVPENGMLLGHADGQPALLVRLEKDEVFAVSAACTHYGGPLAKGLLVDGEIRCPWHHACFDVRSGEAIRAPALDPLQCWTVERRGSQVVVGLSRPAPSASRSVPTPSSVVIVGAGAAGNAAAETLRREGFAGPVTMIGGDPAAPVDRPVLSKDYLAGNAPESWVPLRDSEFYAARKIELVLGVRVESLDPEARRLRLSDGTTRDFGALVLATGADPVELDVPGGNRPWVHTLRSLSDTRAILANARTGSRAVVVGAGFIGLEVAASLRTRGMDVHVVAPGDRPLERVMGPVLGDFIRTLHEENGVRFHLKRKVARIEEGSVLLDDGTSLGADLVVAGIGVRPAVALAERAGLRLDRGVRVNEFLETSVPGLYAAGDIARWPDPHSGKAIRVEHWVVAERQGQTAARNILGRREPFRSVPFFWSRHFDVTINYVGYSDAWEEIEIAGNPSARRCVAAFRERGRIAAIATVHRDRVSLHAEALFEQQDQAGLEALMARARMRDRESRLESAATPETP